MGNRLRIINICRYFTLIFPCKVAEHIFVTLFSCSKSHDLNRILTELIHHIRNQIKSLLVSQTGYDTDHHGLLILIQSKCLLKRKFILYLFLAEIRYIVVVLDHRVRRRIPLIIIKTIYDTGQTVGSCIHQTVQALSVERLLDLFCIGIADSRHLVRINDTAL